MRLPVSLPVDLTLGGVWVCGDPTAIAQSVERQVEKFCG